MGQHAMDTAQRQAPHHTGGAIPNCGVGTEPLRVYAIQLPREDEEQRKLSEYMIEAQGVPLEPSSWRSVLDCRGPRTVDWRSTATWRTA